MMPLRDKIRTFFKYQISSVIKHAKFGWRHCYNWDKVDAISEYVIQEATEFVNTSRIYTDSYYSKFIDHPNLVKEEKLDVWDVEKVDTFRNIKMIVRWFEYSKPELEKRTTELFTQAKGKNHDVWNDFVPVEGSNLSEWKPSYVDENAKDRWFTLSNNIEQKSKEYANYLFENRHILWD